MSEKVDFMTFDDRIKSLRRVPASQLVVNEKNWRKHPDAQRSALLAVLERVGLVNAAIGRELPDGRVQLLDGHLRQDVLGDQKLPVLIVEVNDEEADLVLTTLDPLAAMAEIDADQLDSLIASVKVDDESLQSLLNDLKVEAGLVPEPKLNGDGEVPDPPKKPVTKPGDVWRLGQHRLVCGDSTKAATLKKLMAKKKARALLTDPPYNLDYEGKTSDALTIANDAMDSSSFRAFIHGALTTAFAVLDPGSAFYIWCASLEIYNVHEALNATGEQARQLLIWVKNSMVLGRQDYQWIHEPCLYGWTKGASHRWQSDRKQTTVLNFDRPTRNAEHPTMKPVPLIEYLMLNCTTEGELVLDTFLGSGTTLIASEHQGRVCYGCELSPAFCDVIVERWETLTGKTAKRNK